MTNNSHGNNHKNENKAKHHQTHKDPAIKADPPKKPRVAGRIKEVIAPSDRKEIEAKVQELTVALQRERADTINIRNRHDKQIASLRQSAKANIINELLPAIDTLERALEHVPKDLENHNYVKGVSSVAKQFDKALESIGVERIKTVGEVFNPELHEAVSMEEGEGHKEIITEELQAGYQIGDEVIRHAMVKVKPEN